MLIDLNGRVAVITGVGKGIGREIVHAFAREGTTVIAVDVNAEDLATLDAEFVAAGYPGARINLDIRDGAAVTAAMAEVAERFGGIDILVNNAGVTGDGWVDEITERAWDFCFDVNVKGTFLMCQAALPYLKRSPAGRIINAASFAAIVPSSGSAAYAAAKAAVVQFSRTLAGELGPWGITVNAYAPGMIPTTLNNFADLPEAAQDRLLDTLSLREWGAKSDVADLLCFLASDQARYITGTLHDVSGGKYAVQIPRAAYERAGSVPSAV